MKTLRTRAASLASAAAMALVLATASAAAPTDQYQTFNRIDTTITDANTGLVWQREVVFKAPNQLAAIDYCRNVYKQNPPSTPWRLPTMKELLTIVDETPHYEFEGIVNQAKMIDVNAFPHSPTDAEYWTSSIVANSSAADGWVVKFRTGENGPQGVNLPGYVRCVTP
ncbi:MAG: hypothetical protein JWM74_3616 [Myxococcaceae bacterium]|nr:hypothetical protein [Myxococcaceae bacterium]